MTKTAPQLENLRVALVADADADTRALHRTWLEQSGWLVEEAEDGREALVKAIDRRPLLLVTEVRLPFIDGYDLCRLLRLDEQTRDTHIVVITADAQAALTGRARTVGADAVLNKPCALESFIEHTEALPARSPAVPVSTLPTGRHGQKAKANQRCSTARPACAPPQFVCPQCDSALRYDFSHVGGVSATNGEQWDYFTCRGRCLGVRYQYRHRTRKLRSIS